MQVKAVPRRAWESCEIDCHSASRPLQPAIRVLCCWDTNLLLEASNKMCFVFWARIEPLAHTTGYTCATGACFTAHRIKFIRQCSEGRYVISYRTLFWKPLHSVGPAFKLKSSQVLADWQMCTLCRVPKDTTEFSRKLSPNLVSLSDSDHVTNSFRMT